MCSSLYKNNNDRFRLTNCGFSLVEVLVSLSIFLIVVTISVGALMVTISANATEQGAQQVMTNLTFTLDAMTRDIRTGNDYYCGAVADLPTSGTLTNNCATQGEGFSFNESGDSLTKNASSRRISYRLNGTTIERRLGDGDWEPMTSSDISVSELRFYGTGATRGDNESPTLTIYISGKAGDDQDGTQSKFNIQTTVVQQLLDI